MTGLRPLILKELQEDLRSGRGTFLLIAAVFVLSVFSALLVSNTELSLLDNAEAVYMMTGIVISLAALMAVIRGSDGFAGERERETLESLLLAPVTGRQAALAKLVGIIFTWLMLYLLSIPYLWAVGSTGQNLLPTFVYLLITGTFIVLILGGMTLVLSIKMQTFRGVLSVSVTILLLLGSPFMLGASLRQSSVGRVLDFINPMAGALNTLDSVIIDSQGLVFQLSRLAVMTGYFLLIVWSLHKVARRIEP
jgi:ABC-type transport system involved in multi-copper enzyme maturation permease subunit